MNSPRPSDTPSVPLLDEIRRLAAEIGRTVHLMEVCGTHTMTIFRAGLPALLPENVRLLSGPGCPVCVTPMGYLDAAIALSRRPDTTLATFGDMMRVPGSESALEKARAEGADVRVVYSPLDSLRLAADQPKRAVVFLAVGFETTAPATAITLAEAAKRKLDNFFLLVCHKLVPPALAALLQGAGRNAPALDGFILPGHVSAILGPEPYEFIARNHGIPGVITGFEPEDVLESLVRLLRMVRARQPRIEIQYTRVVRPDGNPAGRRMIEQYFEPCDSEWRGFGRLPASGLSIRPEFAKYDAVRALGVEIPVGREPAGCHCPEVITGALVPEQCPLFAVRCTPLTPVGACMVSSEGTCAAHYRFRPITPGPAAR